jgi:hypothetical protein
VVVVSGSTVVVIGGVVVGPTDVRSSVDSPVLVPSVSAGTSSPGQAVKANMPTKSGVVYVVLAM